MTTVASNRTQPDLVADITTDSAPGALSPAQADRYTIELAIARMNPDPAKVRATIDAFTTKAATPGYWPLVTNTLATTIHLVHAAECQRAGCRTCAAISLAVTTVAAHLAVNTATGGDDR
jgi:hypothetical protein